MSPDIARKKNSGYRHKTNEGIIIMNVYIVEHWSIRNMQDDTLEYYEVFKTRDAALKDNPGICEDDDTFIRTMNINGGASFLCVVNIT